MMIKEQTHSDLAIPPGEYLAEVISELGMTKNELAQRMNRPAPKLSAIFTGDKAITPDTALQLEMVVGVPAHIWTGLEAEYRLTLARNQETFQVQRLQDERKLVTRYNYSELVKLGLVAMKTKPIEKVRELQHFFGVTSLENIASLKRYQVAFRQGAGKRLPEATSAWLRIGELQGQKSESASFKKEVLESVLQPLRSMTRLSPEIFVPQLRQTLLDAGVVLVLSPHLPKTYLHGSTFWLGQNKAVLMLTIRGRWADIFWFSFFHELGHLLLHGKQMVFLEGDIHGDELEKFEIEANKFAADILIPPKDYDTFTKTKSFYKQDIDIFARRLDIDPGIVVGRLQHDGLLEPSWQNCLRSRYEWKDS
ncbi:HigA family addiction module antidote protein [candidate division KSB1 bacterium]|nr:HigA family addiction module antidote protein [candidate division KSB1 bacterium]